MSETTNNHVVIEDSKVPFMSMAIFMVKAAIASIPAFVILAIIGAVIPACWGGLGEIIGS